MRSVWAVGVRQRERERMKERLRGRKREREGGRDGWTDRRTDGREGELISNDTPERAREREKARARASERERYFGTIVDNGFPRRLGGGCVSSRVFWRTG